MEPGEIPVVGSGKLHAEIDVLNLAKASGITYYEKSVDYIDVGSVIHRECAIPLLKGEIKA